jgi:hypothetical protein
LATQQALKLRLGDVAVAHLCGQGDQEHTGLNQAKVMGRELADQVHVYHGLGDAVAVAVEGFDMPGGQAIAEVCIAGWGGYWLDRALFPYDRPHSYLMEAETIEATEATQPEYVEGVFVGAGNFGASMLRRAIIVAACLICVGLGA